MGKREMSSFPKNIEDKRESYNLIICNEDSDIPNPELMTLDFCKLCTRGPSVWFGITPFVPFIYLYMLALLLEVFMVVVVQIVFMWKSQKSRKKFRNCLFKISMKIR